MDAQPPNGYFDAATIADIFDMPRESFLQTVRRNIRTNGFEHRIGRRVYFRAADVHTYLLDKAVDKVRPKDDPATLATIREKQAAARKRELEAQRLEIEFNEKAGRSLPRENVHAFHSALADRLRVLGDQFGRKRQVTGEEAQRRINSLLDTMSRELESICGL